jgi:hypothetical protein
MNATVNPIGPDIAACKFPVGDFDLKDYVILATIKSGESDIVAVFSKCSSVLPDISKSVWKGHYDKLKNLNYVVPVGMREVYLTRQGKIAQKGMYDHLCRVLSFTYC